jgi:hypothetical protein
MYAWNSCLQWWYWSQTSHWSRRRSGHGAWPLQVTSNSPADMQWLSKVANVLVRARTRHTRRPWHLQ